MFLLRIINFELSSHSWHLIPLLITSNISHDPLTFNEALQSPDNVEWQVCMEKELESLAARKHGL